MSVSLQTNVNSLIAQQNLNVTNRFQSQTITQLTSGYRINSSGDDAAGLAVANKFRSSVAELTQGVANGNDATAQLQIMDGGMSNISQILDRLKTLATQSASGTFTGDRNTLNSEFQADVGEIDRQAQSIGLDTGGTFAKNLSVYLGQGSGSGDGAAGAQALNNANVGLDLSLATVDAGSLGLKGLTAIAGTVGAAGTDIGTGSSAGTTVADIVSQATGNSQARTGYATFNLSGPGFSDGSKVSVQASLSGVTDTASLATAINQAIANQALSNSSLKSAGIVASVNTDQFGHQQLAFNSSNTAFQVQAGDQMANALMGNFATAGSAVGKAVTSTLTGATAGVSTDPIVNPSSVSVQISGAGLAAPVSFTLSSVDQTVSDATGDLIRQVANSKTMQDAGISVSMTSANKLQFSSATGASFNVSSIGDTGNALGLGTFVTTSALNGAAQYSDISAATSYTAAATGNGIATLGFSLDGGATGGISAATVTGSVTGTGYNGSGTPNGTVANAAGALGAMTLTLNGSTTVTVDFSKDANQSGTESLQQVANLINSQIQSLAGYGSDVKLATVDSATKTIQLTGTADDAGTIVASGAAATALGLTADSGAHIVAASGSAGNTVSVNLAGGNATSAVATGTAAAPASIATGTNTLALKIDGVAVNADFSKDSKAAGTAADFTSQQLGLNGAASTLDVSSLQGAAGTLSTAVLGTTVDVQTGNQVAYAAINGGVAATNATTAVDLTKFMAQKATVTGTALGTVADPSLTALNLKQFAATTAQATGSSLGADANAHVDLSAFKALAATTTTTKALASTLDLTSFGATEATFTGDSVAASGAADMTGALGGLSDKLIVSVTDGTVSNTKSKAIVVSGCQTLQEVADAINSSAAGDLNNGTTRINAQVVDGALQLTNDATNMAKGKANTITIAANNASLAVGLSKSGAIRDTVATGVDATTLDLTVDAVGTTTATKGSSTITNGANFTALTVGQYAATKAVVSTGAAFADDTTSIPAVALLDGTTKLTIHVDQGGASSQVDLTGCTTLDSVVTAINHSNAGGPIANVLASANAGKLYLTNTAAAGAGHTISVDAGAAATALHITTTSGASADMVGLKIKIDNLGTTNVDISGASNMHDIATAIGAAVHGLDPSYLAADVVTDNLGKITLTSKTTGTSGTIHIDANAASAALGLTSDSSTATNVAGNATPTLNKLLSLDVSSDQSASDIAQRINTAVNGIDNTKTYAKVAVANADGTITLTANNTGASSHLSVANNALSQQLGLASASGSQDNNQTGFDATKLKVNIDGLGENDIDVSGATTVGQVVNTINAFLSGAHSGYTSVASGVTGALTLTSNIQGAKGSVNVMDNTVSQALHLTSGSDSNNGALDATKLMLSVDGKSEIGIDVSQATTLNGLIGIINARTDDAVVTGAGSADGGFGGGYGSVASTDTTNAIGSLLLTGVNTGATGASAGNVTIEDNAISRLLGLTSGGKVNQGGKDAVDLVVQIDGGKAESIDLSALGGTANHPTLTEMAAGINAALHTNQAVLDGYSVGTTYAYVDQNSTTGTLTIKGGVLGSSLTITNNDLSQQLKLATKGAGDATSSRADQTLNLRIDGHQQVDIALDQLTTTAKLSDVATAINNALKAATAQGYGAAYGSVAKANSDGTISLTGVDGGKTITVLNSKMSAALQLTSGTSNSTNTGAAPETLGISIDGKAATQVSFAGITGGKTPTLQGIADAINAQLTKDTNYGASYANAKANVDGTITIASKGTGSTNGSVTVYNTAAGQALGLTSGVNLSTTITGKEESVADVVSFLNTTARQTLGASTDAKIVSLDSSGNVVISSQTKGANSSVSVDNSGTTGGLAVSLHLDGYGTTAATGQARSLQSVVDALKVSFNSNTILQQAGMTAGINQGALEISSSTGTQFRVDAWGTKAGSDLGFGTTGTAFNGNNALTPKSTASTVDTQGASAIGTFANTRNSASISFQNMQFGNDDQSLIITANSAAGVAQTPLTVTLQNDSTAQTGANIDSAVAAINAKLQQSGNATMRSITAVRETGADGSESINLISSLSSFNVSVSNSAGAAVGDGLNGGKATTLASAMNGSSSSIAIDTQAGAQQAVIALAAAVAKLGSAQASIGRGQNQLAYGINLAQSQITNFSSAESQIRDTNVAQQAANLSKAQVLSQAAIAAMAQANSAPQGVLALLRG